MNLRYNFEAELWRHKGSAGWYFVALPDELSAEIRLFNHHLEEGWGRLKARAQLGSSEWDTAIWYDTRQQSYLLPIKASIRLKEKLQCGDKVLVSILI